MMAMLIVILVIIAVALFQIFRQGLFSSALMAVFTLVSAIAAMSYYEPLAQLISDFGAAPYCPAAVSFLGLFASILLVLRLAADKFIRGNMNFPYLVDRVGSAFFGLIAGLTVAGAVAIGIQLLPIAPKIAGFDRCPDRDNPAEENHLLGRPDQFVVALTSLTSSYGFAGKNLFAQLHPAFLQELYMNRLTLDPASRREAAPGSLEIVQARFTDDVIEAQTNQPWGLKPSETALVIGFKIKPGADNKKNRGAKDVDGHIRFAYGNLHVVGCDPDSPAATSRIAYPVGFVYPGGKVARRLLLTNGKTFASAENRVDLLFPWPQNVKTMRPTTLVFKGTALASLPSIEKMQTAEPQDIKGVFAGLPPASEAEIRESLTSKTKMYEKIIVVNDRMAQPLRDMGLPPDSVIAKAKEEGKLNEMEYEGKLLTNQFEFKQVHLLLSLAASKAKTEEDKIKSLFIPEGYVLVLVSFAAPSSEGLSEPALVDHAGGAYLPVGWWIQGTKGMDNLGELAYESSAPQKPFPYPPAYQKEKMENLKGYFLYLVPGGSKIGIIGCRSQKGQGAFYPLKDSDLLVAAGL